MRVLAILSVLAPMFAAQGPSLELSTDLPVTGVEFAVRALDEQGHATGGARLELRDGHDQKVADVVTADDGTAHLTIAIAGPYVLAWLAAGGVEVLVPFHVDAPRSPFAPWTVPLGLLLGWSAWRWRNSSRTGAQVS